MTSNTNSFDSGLASGTAITTSNGLVSGREFDNVTGTPTYDSTHANSGTLAMKVDMSGGTTQQVRWVDGADQSGAVSYIRFYVYMTANPGANNKVAVISSHGNAFNCQIRIKTDGTVDMVDNTVTVMGGTTTAIALNQWVRIEAKVTVNASTGSGVIRLYNTAASSTPDETVTTTAAWNTGSANAGQWRFGGNNASTDVYWLDDIATSDTDWLGAYVAPTSTGFPTDPTDLDIEMNLGGTWTNLRSGGYVLDRGVTIARGRSDEAGQIEPSALSMTLDNTDGRFSPRNPTGPYYGQLGRNTPVRASVTRGTAVFMDLPGDTGDEATTPDATALGITGDIDIRIDLTTDSWCERNLCAKWETTGNQRSWAMQISRDGKIYFIWSTDGTAANEDAIASTVPVPTYPGRRALRLTFDVDDGASGFAANFYTSDTISGTWTQLGETITTTFLGATGTVSFFDSTAGLEVGGANDVTTLIGLTGASHFVAGRVHKFELYSGIAGTLVANPDFTAQPVGATNLFDSASTPNLWTLGGNASITNRRWRFHGELASLPPRWDISGNDVYVPVTANGILRRLRQGSSPLKSSIYRAISTEAGVVDYWPCEDDSGATSIASGVQGNAMSISGSASFASSSAFAASDDLPTTNNSKWTGTVRAYTPTAGSQTRFLLYIPSSASVANNTVVASVHCTGKIKRIDVIYLTTTSGSITWKVYGDDNAVIYDGTGSYTSTLNDETMRISVEMTQNGSNVDLELWVQEVADSSGAVGSPQTINSSTCGVVSSVVIDPNKSMGDVTVGHISVHSEVTSILDLTDELVGYEGENAYDRVRRLCDEEGLSFRGIGIPSESVEMGVQKSGSLSDLFQECADAEDGMLFEPRDLLGIGFRTRNSMYNQTARVTLDYSSEELSDSLEPTDDDQNITNDVTVTRVNGSSSRVEQTTGAMSTAEPPTGIGRYQDSVSLSLYRDDQTEDQAAWRLHVGTVDEARYPVVSADYTNDAISGSESLTADLLDAEVGDMLTLTNLPAWLPPDDVNQVVQGMSESYENYQHTVSFNCTPESPYRIGLVDSARVDTSGSELDAAVSSGATSLNVNTTSGAEWTTDAGDLPFDIMCGGERMTVTAIADTDNITDSFTRADSSSSLGSTDTGEAWSADVNTWGISSNTAYAVNSSNSIAVVETNHTDVQNAQVTVSTWAAGEAWINLRYADSSNRNRVGGTLGSALHFEVVSGGSVVATYVSTATLAAGDTIAVSANGNDYVVSQNGTVVLEVHDETNTTGTKVGLQTQNNGNRFDNFSVRWSQTFTVTRSVNGVSKAQTAGTALSIAEPVYVGL